MLKKIHKIFILLLLLNISSIAFSEIREIKTIEEYSRQFLDENFVLEDLKQEENEIIKEINTDNLEEKTDVDIEDNEIKDLEIKKAEEAEVIEKDISEEKYEKEMTKIAELDEKISVDKKVNKTNIEWDFPDNFRAIIIGDTNGNVYYSKNADKIYPLASVTKMMTLMVTFDEIKARRISLQDRVKIGKIAVKQGGSGIKMKVGQIFRLEDLIKASAIYSANNATYAIAEHIGKGNLNGFVKKMNNKAKKLGLQNDIKYFTPAGLPTRMTKQPMDSGTARAIYKLSIEALKYKNYIKIAGIKNTKIYGGKIKIKNRNHLLGKEGVYGIKTGYHKEAKYNIAVASKIDNMDIIIVVMGGKTYTLRDKAVLDAIKIFKENYYVADILNTKRVMGEVTVIGTKLKAKVVPDKNYKIALKKNQKYRVEINQRNNIKLNVFVGEDLGEYRVYIDDKIVLTGRIKAEKSIKR